MLSTGMPSDEETSEKIVAYGYKMSKSRNGFKFCFLYTIVIIITRVIIVLEILTSTPSPIALSFNWLSVCLFVYVALQVANFDQ